VQDPSPDWGLAVSKYYGAMNPVWWPVVFPCLAIASLVVSVNLVADALQEAQT
jgi:peptide/nickel transport system permease protein